MERKSLWETYDQEQKKEAFDFAENYKAFLSKCKTERECVEEAIRLAREQGFLDLSDCIREGRCLAPGDKVYAENRGKNLALFVIGSRPLEEGMNILGAHIDSPRLDLKQNPLYEDSGMALLETHYYGGIKKYQWVAVPLALHGVVAKKDGTVIRISIGEQEDEPVFCVTDLLVHLSGEQLEKKGKEVVEGENLNILVGNMPLAGEEKEAVHKQILRLLKERYDMEEEDFLSAEIEAVPAGRARDFGLDSSMVISYGQDDRVCAYPSLRALFDTEKPEKTCACLLVDKEEIGSVGASGMNSTFFTDTVAELMECMGGFMEIGRMRAFRRSNVLSSDVSAAFDPNYPAVMEKNNCAYLGKGIVFNKYTGRGGKSGSNDADAEYIAKLRRIMAEHQVSFQTAELGKVDQGGGGTIAYILANYNMNVIDSGVAVLNMHAPWEVASKADIYEALRCYRSFLRDM